MAFDMHDPDTKAQVNAMIESAVQAVKATAEEETAALQKSNAKLLKQLRAAQQGAEIDPIKHAALEDKVVELEGKLSAANKDVAKLQKEFGGQVQTLTKQLAQENGFTQKLLVDNGLSDALVKAGVPTGFLPAVKALLSPQVAIVQDGELRRAMVGELPLAAFVDTWAQSEDGKHYVKAPLHSGGGANGGTGAVAMGAKTVIAAGDKLAFGANLAELAKGTNSAVQIASQ